MFEYEKNVNRILKRENMRMRSNLLQLHIGRCFQTHSVYFLNVKRFRFI